MKTREDLRLAFEAWFKATFAPTPDMDQRKIAIMQEIARRAYYEGNAVGFNDGLSAGAEMEGSGRR